jgi:PiT family inorganic phosphate transporter
MIFTILFIVACCLAYNNGANDNFKGVATLFGSGTSEYRGAITWATVTTFMGSVASIFLAKTLVKNFSGKGLVPDELILSPEFAISVVFGAALTIFIATKIGMPVSTTHVSVGSIFGIGTATQKADLKVIRQILFSWILTLPVAAACSATIYWLQIQIF